MNQLGENRLCGEYRLDKLLGQGGFGQVFSAVCLVQSEHRDVAIKCIPSERDYGRLREEINVLRKCKHLNIVEFYGQFDVDIEMDHTIIPYTCIVMDKCDTDMKKYLNEKLFLQETEAVYYLRQLLLALQYLHDKMKVIYRDLKLSNLLLKKTLERNVYILKLCDFGMVAAIDHPDNEQYTMCGTLDFIAPEVIAKENQTYARDIHSAGSVFYNLVTGVTPFKKETNEETMAAITYCIYDTTDERISADGYDFLKQTLALDPKKRLTARQALSHAIFKSKFNFDSDSISGISSSSVSMASYHSNLKLATPSKFASNYPSGNSLLNASQVVTPLASYNYRQSHHNYEENHQQIKTENLHSIKRNLDISQDWKPLGSPNKLAKDFAVEKLGEEQYSRNTLDDALFGAEEKEKVTFDSRDNCSDSVSHGVDTKRSRYMYNHVDEEDDCNLYEEMPIIHRKESDDEVFQSVDHHIVEEKLEVPPTEEQLLALNNLMILAEEAQKKRFTLKPLVLATRQQELLMIAAPPNTGKEVGVGGCTGDILYCKPCSSIEEGCEDEILGIFITSVWDALDDVNNIIVCQRVLSLAEIEEYNRILAEQELDNDIYVKDESSTSLMYECDSIGDCHWGSPYNDTNCLLDKEMWLKYEITANQIVDTSNELLLNRIVTIIDSISAVVHRILIRYLPDERQIQDSTRKLERTNCQFTLMANHEDGINAMYHMMWSNGILLSSNLKENWTRFSSSKKIKNSDQRSCTVLWEGKLSLHHTDYFNPPFQMLNEHNIPKDLIRYAVMALNGVIMCTREVRNKHNTVGECRIINDVKIITCSKFDEIV